MLETLPMGASTWASAAACVLPEFEAFGVDQQRPRAKFSVSIICELPIPRPNRLSAASERHRHTGPLGGAWEANPRLHRIMRGKAACHSVGPILWHLLSLVAAGGTDGP